MKILIHIHPELVGGSNQCLKGIPCPDALSGACLQAHIAFADALSGTQLRRVVVQENLRMGKHHQQGFFLGMRPGETLIQLLIAAALPEEVIKGRPQCIRLCRIGIVSVGQQISVELPEVFGKLLQEVAMGQEAWGQFLVMAIFMDPAQG